MACEYIIIVDDERETGELLVEALQIRGYEADHFDNPDMLLENTELKDLLADSALIITDRTMPPSQLRGENLADTLRRMGYAKPIILSSGELGFRTAEGDTLEERFSKETYTINGKTVPLFNGYLKKPVTLDTLWNTVAQHTQNP